MRRLLIAILVLAALWSGWWAVARGGVIRALDAGEAQVAARGIALEYADRGTGGFPTRIDTTWRDMVAIGPGWRYEVPLVQLFALSYRPDKAILFAPGPHVMHSLAGRIALDSEDARASLRVVPGRGLVIDRATAEITAPRLALNDQPMGSAARALVALRRSGPPEGRVQIYALAEDLTLPALRGAPADWPEALPRAITRLELDVQADLSAAPALRGAAPLLRGLDIRQGSLSWGAAQLDLSGTLEVGSDGRLDGRLMLRGENWQPVLQAAVALGLMEPGIAETWQNLGERVSAGGALALPLPVRDGQVMLGPVPIAVLPRIY